MNSKRGFRIITENFIHSVRHHGAQYSLVIVIFQSSALRGSGSNYQGYGTGLARAIFRSSHGEDHRHPSPLIVPRHQSQSAKSSL